MFLPGLLLGLQTAAAAKLTSAVVAAETYTATVAATAGAVKVTAASVVSTEAAVCTHGCKTRVHTPQ